MGFPKGGQYKRMTLRKFLTAMPAGESFMVDTQRERNNWINLAQKNQIPLAAIKRNGIGWEIVRLKYRPVYRCPKCGWKEGDI